MKKILVIALFLGFAFGFRAYSQAPENKEIVVEKSTEKTVIQGKTYYLHTVKKKENLYRISLAYGVTVKDIILANPETISGNVKEGQVLKIPAESNAPRNIKQIESDNFIYHVAEEKQTIFFLTQKYNISKEELFKYNPELEKNGLKIGQVVRIPKHEDVSTGTDTFKPIEKYIEHKVRRRETKYSISKKYDITIDELIKANPDLNTRDLQNGERLRIPVKSDTQFVAEPPVVTDTVPATEAFTLDTISCTQFKPYSQQFNVALLLPFSIEENEARAQLDSAANANSPDNPPVKSELLPRTAFSLEFYEGFLLAVDSLKKAGLSVRIHTFDTGKDVASTNKILAKPELSGMDLMIGPFFSEGLDKAAEFTTNQQIKQVSIVSPNSPLIRNNPYFFQVMPSDSIYVDSIAGYFSSYPKKFNLILVKSNLPKDDNIFSLFKRRLDSNLYKPYQVYDYKNNVQQLNKMLADSIDNIVVIPSTNEGFVFTVFSGLNLVCEKYQIKVYGMPECARFTSIEPDLFHNLQFHYYTSFFADYNNPVFKKFVSEFIHKYHYEPQNFIKEGFNFAGLGYDIGMYFLNALGRMGEDFEGCLKNYNPTMVYSKFDFRKACPSCGFMNHGIEIIEYTKDYYLKKANNQLD